MNHTIGIWYYNHPHILSAPVLSDDGKSILSKGRLICTINGNKWHGENLANAAIIAAAPELLHALKEFWDVASHHAGPRIQELVESAIKKAEQK